MDFKKFFEELDEAVDEDEELHEKVKTFIEKMRTLTYQEAVQLQEAKWFDQKHERSRNAEKGV